jgi:nucleotide-binding universal stress UspA family protein
VTRGETRAGTGGSARFVTPDAYRGLLDMNILCGVDESGAGREAAFAAALLAHRAGGRLTLLRTTQESVTSPPRTAASAMRLNVGAGATPSDAARRELVLLAEEIRGVAGVRPDVRVERGRPADRLLAAAEDTKADMIVIGERTEKWDRLAESADVPILVVPSGATPAVDGDVALALEAGRPPTGAAAAAAWLALQLGAGITVVHVLASPRAVTEPVLPMQRAARAAIDAAVPTGELDVRHVTAYERPAADLARTLRQLDAAVAVVDAPRRHGWRRLLRPGLSDRVGRARASPVMIVPEGAAMGSAAADDGVAAEWLRRAS